MFCTKCGEKLPDDAQFCEKCGARVEKEDSKAPAPAAAAPKNNSQSVERMKRFIMANKKKIGIAAGVLVVVIVLAVFLATRPVKVDLNDYIYVEYEGYNTVGRAHHYFDFDAFCGDYAGKIKYRGKDNQIVDTLFDEQIVCRMLIDEYVNWDLDQMSKLSNGDVVHMEWDCDDERAKADFGIQLSYENQDFTVEGLNEPEAVDPFDGAHVSFEGISPYGRVQFEGDRNAPYGRELVFNVEPRENLKNGDTVTVSLKEADEQAWKDYLVETYGVTLSKKEMSYTVEGLQTYLSKLSEVSEDAFTQMKAQAEDVMKANAAKNWAKESTMDSTTYVGSYLLTPKSQQAYDGNNQLYLVYEIKATVKNPKDESQESITYYYTVRYDDLLVSADGTVEVDLTDYRTNNPSFSKELAKSRYYFDGYESLDEAYNRCVTSNLDRYNFETDIAAE